MPTLDALRERPYLSPTQTASVFGHSPAFWREQYFAEEVAGYKVGGRVLIETATVHSFIDAHRVGEGLS